MELHTALNQEQHEAVENIYGPILVLAGAGSGKTRVVIYRIVNLLSKGIDPGTILGVTFTNKAAKEMQERINKLTDARVLICTFHSLGARILRESVHVLGYRRDFTIYDEQDTEKLMKICLEEMGGKLKIDAKGFLHRISRAKNAMQAPNDINTAELDEMEKAFPEVYAKYQEKLLMCNAVDFDDLLYLPVKLFQEHEEMLQHYQNRWNFLLIDEFQDTNVAQYALVRKLVAKHNNLCVVGDPDQSIYSWRGADIGNILGFENDYPGARAVHLQQNYRSRTNILDAANELIMNNRGRYEKNLWSDRGAGEKIKHYTADTERNEASFVAEKVQYHYEHNNIPLKQMAVFYRTNAQSRALEDKLLQHQIPYVIVGGISFYQRREVKDILAFLRMVQSGMDYISFARTINIPKRGLGEASIDKIRVGAMYEGLAILNYCVGLVGGADFKHSVRLSSKQKEALKSYVDIIHDLKEISKACSLKELVKAAIERSGYLEHLKTEPDSFDERKENLNGLISKAYEWEITNPAPTLEGFLEELSLKSSLDEAETDLDKINLMTIHNGKGLEFEVVFLVGMEEDLFPHANSRDSAPAQEEERRLCYVGMTRAKEYLYLCDVRQRFLWGTTRLQRPSRFLNEIPSRFVEKLRTSYTAKAQPVQYQESKGLGWRRHQEEEEVAEPFADELGSVGMDEEFIEISVGDTVFHSDFGIGVMNKVYEGSIGLTYKVLFTNDNRERSLVARLAKLKKL